MVLYYFSLVSIQALILAVLLPIRIWNSWDLNSSFWDNKASILFWGVTVTYNQSQDRQNQ